MLAAADKRPDFASVPTNGQKTANCRWLCIANFRDFFMCVRKLLVRTLCGFICLIDTLYPSCLSFVIPVQSFPVPALRLDLWPSSHSLFDDLQFTVTASSSYFLLRGVWRVLQMVCVVMLGLKVQGQRTQLGVVPVICQSELLHVGHINLNNEKSPVGWGRGGKWNNNCEGEICLRISQAFSFVGQLLFFGPWILVRLLAIPLFLGSHKLNLSNSRFHM